MRHQQDIATTPRRTLYRARAVFDAANTSAAPGVILAEGSTILAAGAPEHVGRIDSAVRVDVPGVLIPGLVNVHTHLDLTSVGPQPMEGTFIDWVRMILRVRGGADDDAIARAVRAGIDGLRRGGTALVGDIAGAGSLVPARVQREAGMQGVSYVEFFGTGERQQATIERMNELVDNTPAREGGVVLGISPHAPYSCGPEVYGAAARLGIPFATHLAETTEEIEFAKAGKGPFADFLRDLGLWNDTVGVLGRHPVDAVLAAVENLSILAVHLNHVSDEHIEQLAHCGAHVAYCPRASAYFGHAGHRYRDMLAHGINVALGTDSIICLDTPDRLSTLDEMRFLLQRDGTPVRTLLAMATTHGARALGFDPALVTFAPGAVLGILSLEAADGRPGDNAERLLERAIATPQAPTWILNPEPCAAVSST